MSETGKYETIMSPCNNQCRNDVENEYCISCFRTIKEKKNWWKYSVEEKKEILKDLSLRAKKW